MNRLEELKEADPLKAAKIKSYMSNLHLCSGSIKNEEMLNFI